MGSAHPYVVKDNKQNKKNPNTTKQNPQVPVLVVRLHVPGLLAVSEWVELLFNASYSKERREKWISLP